MTLESEALMATEWWRLLDQLRRVRFGIADLELSRERVRAQIAALEQKEAKLAAQAVKARQMGRDDLARIALARQQEAAEHRGELAVQVDRILGEEAKLTTAARRLETKKALYQFGLDTQGGEDTAM
jgi:phage shock protein A